MTGTKRIGLTATIIALLLIYSSLYVVYEGQQAMLLRLGTIVTNARANTPYIMGPGLHFKWPFVTTAALFDTRLQTLDIKSSRIVTAEQKDLIVDYYVKWRITNLPLYFTRTGGNLNQTALLLEQQLNDSLRAQCSRRTISDIVSNDRSSIMDALSKQANLSAQSLGISVLDVRIKSIDLPNEVRSAFFDRMRAGRERVATEYRFTGKAEAEAIRANADANAALTIANATAEAAMIRSQGDAQAAKIYSDAYSQDPAFFSFLRSLEAYKKVFSDNPNNNMLVLRPDSEFFKYFNNPNGNGARR